MCSTDQLKVREVEEQLRARLRGHDVMKLEPGTPLAVLVSTAVMIPSTHHPEQLLRGARRIGTVVRLVQRSLPVALSLAVEVAFHDSPSDSADRIELELYELVFERSSYVRDGDLARESLDAGCVQGVHLRARAAAARLTR